MYIVILGASKIGSYAAKTLSHEGHNVALIDKDAKKLEQLGRESDIATLHTSGSVWKTLESVVSDHPALFFAATDDDELNLVACSIAKKLGFPKTVARIQSREILTPSHLNFKHLFHVDHFIGAELAAAHDLFKVLIHAGDIAVEHFAHGTIQMRTISIPAEWDKEPIPIRDLSLPDELIIGLIRRKPPLGEEEVRFPGGDDFILHGDEVTLVGTSKIMHRLHEIFFIPEEKIRSVILAGGSLIARYLAHFLIQQKISVRIIDESLTRCEELAECLPQATIIHHDAKDTSFLLSEHIQEADALVTCTNNDAINLQIAALAKHLDCPKSIAMITDPSLTPLLEKLGVTPALSAQVNLVNRLLSILHEETILAVSPLSNDQAKIVELKVRPSSKLIGIPLSQLSLPKDLLIAVIENQGEVMIGRGHRILGANDTAIAICHPQHLTQLHELFQ